MREEYREEINDESNILKIMMDEKFPKTEPTSKSKIQREKIIKNIEKKWGWEDEYEKNTNMSNVKFIEM